MKLVALHTDFRIYWPARLKALNEALTKRGDTLDVIEIAGKGSPYAFAETSNDKDLNWQILFPNSKPEELIGKQFKPSLFELLDKINPDVILAGAIAFPSGALAVQWVNSRKNKRVIVFDDAKIEAVKRNPIVNFVKQCVYNGVDAMFYPAEDWIPTGKFWKFSENQMFFGVDVVDNDFWSKPRPHKPFDFKYFVSVGRQIPKKNFDKILEAYSIYVNKVGKTNAINFILIGDGPEHDNLLYKIKELGTGDKVTMLPFKTQEELASIYQYAEALIINSNIEETWGLVINEAMACGCPIFASNQCGATNMLVKNDINGYRFDCNDTRALSDSLIKFHQLSDIEKQKMRKESIKIIAKWGLDKFADGVVKAADYCLTSPSKKIKLLGKLIISKWNGQYRPI